MNRRLFADPDLPRKVLQADVKDINPCNSCMTCFDACEHFQPIKCRVNASLGREREYAITPTRRKKKVVIIGGGPAGMEAARVAALRGHEVVLYEKQRRLGGSLPVAALVKGPREDIQGLITYLDRQVRQAGVTVHLGKAPTAQAIDAEHADAIVVAAGGTRQFPTSLASMAPTCRPPPNCTTRRRRSPVRPCADPAHAAVAARGSGRDDRQASGDHGRTPARLPDSRIPDRPRQAGDHR